MLKAARKAQVTLSGFQELLCDLRLPPHVAGPLLRWQDWSKCCCLACSFVVMLRLFPRVLAPALNLFAVYSGVDFCGVAQLQRAG